MQTSYHHYKGGTNNLQSVRTDDGKTFTSTKGHAQKKAESYMKKKSMAGKMKKGMHVPSGETKTKHGFSGTENMNEMGGNTGIKPRK